MASAAATTVAVGAGSSLLAPNFITTIKGKFVDDTLVPIVTEMMRIFPDGLVITSGFYAIFTLSFSFAVFFMSMLEATLILNALQYAGSYLNIAPISAKSKSYEGVCRTGFTDANTGLASLSLFSSDPLKNPFPSSPIFMLSTAAAYMFSTLNSQSKELAALGPAYASRYYVSAFFLTMLIFLFVAFRVSYGCDSFGVVMVSVPIGLFVGMLLVQQNPRLFGPEGINLVGIPLLQGRAASGKPIYVCPN